MMEILTTPLGSLDAQLLRGELAAGVTDGGFVLQVEEDFQPLVLSFQVEFILLCAPHFCTESHGFAIFFHVEILGGEGEEGELESSGHKFISAGSEAAQSSNLRWGFTPNQRGEKGKKEMSGIILILGTLLQTSPFSCPFLSTVF